ncbi:MAG: PilZ domain-containing protein [Gammaproteobacteria bacterium]|nr:PilZ domain-containing protein [Gammaproteobacteria bacterium]MDH3448741.1 PilZ domain-containing protein [Gammaproteobacteria bacterium]
MPDNTTIRKFIRHPADVPIQVSLDWVDDGNDDTVDQTITNVSLGGLAFASTKPLEVLQRVRISIPVLNRDNHLIGNVVWCEKADAGYEIGIEFENSRDVYRLRMIEQICHIEHYRREVRRTEGRELDSQEAASEWISKYAGDFPAL